MWPRLIGRKLPNFLNGTAQFGHVAQANWLCGLETSEFPQWHSLIWKLISWTETSEFPQWHSLIWKLWPGPSKFGERRLEARIAGICLAVFKLGFGPQTRIRDYDRRLDGGFGSGRGRPCRYIGLVVLARRTSLVGKAPDSQPRGRGFDSR
jgi:hypothetical protein